MPKVIDSHNPVGEIKAITASSVPDGFLICNGDTIGTSSSGATKQGQAYYDLFVFLWTNYSNTQLVIQNSSGSTSGVTRGASADADFSANKRMPLPNLIGKTLIGAGTYTDSVSGSTTRSLGDSLGAASHKITNAQMPGHNHGGSTGNEGAHTHTDNTLTSGNGALISNTGSVGITVNQVASTTTTGAGSSHSHGVSIDGNGGVSGDGQAHNNMQPSHVTNWMIRY